jgi:hypothetical protein
MSAAQVAAENEKADAYRLAIIADDKRRLEAIATEN